MLERNYQTNATEMADESPLLSVIVTTKNEEKNIGRCLQSIVSQDYSNFEVIVVDNYSELDEEHRTKIYRQCLLSWSRKVGTTKFWDDN